MRCPGPVDSKRTLDLTLAVPALVAAGPLLCTFALAMRVTGDRGPFLYRARRVGEGGRMFTVLKVRTMRADRDGRRLTLADDPRITSLGRFLRRFRLDELPQLVNVVRGEMSLVGPRPEDPHFVDLADPLHHFVFTARPGITGLAQLEFHDEARLMKGFDPEERYRTVILPAKLQLDARYLRDRSLRLDLEIIGRTLGAVLGSDRDQSGVA
jgi:lipopolysaccharide/colanic/teichoic acid biosynthesis glycosyltransferase